MKLDGDNGNSSYAEYQEGGENKMTWPIVVALLLAIPIILLPVILIWYLNISGMGIVIGEACAACKAETKRLKSAEELVR